jgi:magnesium-transporting ATPase (P-type)
MPRFTPASPRPSLLASYDSSSMRSSNPPCFIFDSEMGTAGRDPVHPPHSKLRNTAAFIYGFVIFTGHDSKLMQNSTESPSKRSRIERKMDLVIYILFTVLVLISLISSIGFAVRIKLNLPHWWYLQPQNSRPALFGIFHLITALILYGHLIPISLYVSIEIVKVLQAHFINQVTHMFDEETGNTAQAHTSNLNEELGQVHTILSDKTGTDLQSDGLLEVFNCWSFIWCGFK